MGKSEGKGGKGEEDEGYLLNPSSSPSPISIYTGSAALPAQSSPRGTRSRTRTYSGRRGSPRTHPAPAARELTSYPRALAAYSASRRPPRC
ncbi:hypothetical protein KC324_g1 [Hortaea werneckii]|nr:hypothetical protein KC324_g1 [Hortaea werneckii]